MSESGATPKKPTSFSELYPGRFLHADHLQGKRFTLTIADVALERLHGEKGEQIKAVLAFRETPLLLVLAKINGTALREMFGGHVQGWVGRRVTFYPTAELAPLKKGEPCIRVYGSPDIDRDIDLEYPMPRRKAVKMTLKAMKAQVQTAAAEDVNDEPGAGG